MERILLNVGNGAIPCRVTACMDFYEGKLRTRPKNPCYESGLFKDWMYGSGYAIQRDEKPFRIAHIQRGAIAVFTTLFPGDREEDRKIIGLFKIARIENKQEGDTKVFADRRYRIRLPLEVAKELHFWDYYEIDAKEPKWGSGLFRYLDDVAVGQILRHIAEVVREKDTKEVAQKLFEEIQERVGEIHPPSGMRIKMKRVPSREAILSKRKYGGKGEGPEHKKLKDWVAKHPEFLGLNNIRKTEIEEPIFLTGDHPDIVFHYGQDQYAIVEIETENPYPGAYQLLKYKVLLCALKLLPLDSERVRTFLVTKELDLETEAFCQRYGIEIRVKR
jgi:hypothetical protein